MSKREGDEFVFPQIIGERLFGEGLLLRDWFAGQALPAVIEVCRNDNRTSFAPESIEDYFARQAYAIADAMLAARAMGAA